MAEVIFASATDPAFLKERSRCESYYVTPLPKELTTIFSLKTKLLTSSAPFFSLINHNEYYLQLMNLTQGSSLYATALYFLLFYIYIYLFWEMERKEKARSQYY